MKVLLAGGSGRVGTFVTPYLCREHELRVLDLRPPRHEGVEFVQGSYGDPDVAAEALRGVDAFVTMVMKSPQGARPPSSRSRSSTTTTRPTRGRCTSSCTWRSRWASGPACTRAR